MPKQKHMKRKDDESASESFENEYVKDDFVTDEDEVDDEIQNDSLDDDYNESADEEDLNLIQENQRQQRRGRIHRLEDVEQEEQIQEGQDQLSQSEQIEEEIEEVDQNELMNKLFDPTQRESAFLNQFDDEIIKSNVPESIQLTYAKANDGKLLQQPRNEADEQHVNWVVERIMREYNFQISESNEIIKGVKFILDQYRKENLDVFYIYTYKRYLITKLLQMEHFWRVRELDTEYEQFQRFKQKIHDQIQQLPAGPYTNIIAQYWGTCFYMEQLQNLKDYVEYIQMKIRCKKRTLGQMEEEIIDEENLLQKKIKSKENVMTELMKLKIDEIMYKFCYTADEFFEVLRGNKVELNRKMYSSLDELWQEILNPRHQLVKNEVSAIKTMKKYLLLELFHHPFIREHIDNLYKEHVLISTEPTALGNREITALSYLYPVKRIRHRPLKYMKDSIWMMLLKAEEQGFIKTKFQVSTDLDSKEKVLQKDDIMKQIIDRFMNLGLEKEQEKLSFTRSMIPRSILYEDWYGYLEKQMRIKLKQAATKHILRMCQKQFRSLLNQQPHQSDNKEGEFKIMSLVLGNEGGNVKQLQQYTLDCTVQRKFVGMAVIDSKGEYQQLHVFNYLTVDERREELAESIRKERALLDKFFEMYKPDIVVISTNHADCLNLRAKLRTQIQSSQSHNNKSIFITLAQSQISHIYSVSEQSKQQLSEIPQILKEAISLARYKLNPMAEILNLWNEKIDKNGCLHINFHPLQNMVSQQTLADHLSQMAVEIVNSVGVELVDASLHKHLQEQVSFINGLGPRQAKHLLLMFKGMLSKHLFGNNFENEKLILQRLEQQKKEYIQVSRRDILITQIFGKTVFKNMQGFVKIANGIQPLDITRLQFKMYSDASHIAKCAMDVQVKEDKNNSVVRQLMEKPQNMEDLELEDWAKKKEKEGSELFTEVVKFIREELTLPFNHVYETKNKEMTSAEIFYAVIQESPYTFKKNTIVQGNVVRKYEHQVLVRLSDNGLMGILKKDDCENFDFQLQQTLKAYVKKINALEQQQMEKQQNILTVELSMKAEFNLKECVYGIRPEYWPYSFSYEEYKEKLRSTFDFQKAKEQDIPIIKIPVIQKQQKAIFRNINHPKFKQVYLKGALEYIESQPIGEYLIRPNQKMIDHLTITWKFYEGVIAHLYVQETVKPGTFRPSLILNGETYESFDEIYERYLVPCNLQMEVVANSKKFFPGTMDQLEKKLREEKEKDEEIIPYYFCVTDRAPQYIVLMYMKDKYNIVRECIKVKPEGLSFHSIIHNSLKDLTKWFKDNFRTPEYRQYTRKVKLPFIDQDNRLDLLNQQWEVKKEKVKDEKTKNENQSSNMTCSKCGKRGHTANDCRNKQGCHNCGQSGHIKKNCPQMSRRRERSNSRDREKYSTKRQQSQQPKIEEQIDY